MERAPEPTTPGAMATHLADAHNAKPADGMSMPDMQAMHKQMHATSAPAHEHGGMASASFPRDNLVRAVSERAEVRADGTGSMPTVYGHFARFGAWNLIDSASEGTFLESIAPGAFKKTFAEGRDRFRIMFQHGRDPQVGDKPIATVTELREDPEGPYYEGQLLDASYVRDILPGLQAGVYGASYRFNVMREDVVMEPGVSDYNPDGLPERMIREARVLEAGPVTWGADPMATAGVRSLTDWYRSTGSFDETLKELATSKPKELARMIQSALPSDAGADTATSRKSPTPAKRKEEPAMAVDIDKFTTEEDMSARLEEVEGRQQALTIEYGTRSFDAQAQTEWEELKEERTAINERLAELAERKAEVASIVAEPTKVKTRTESGTVQVIVKPANIYDRAAVYRDASSPEDASRKFKENALRSVEGAEFPNANATKEEQQAGVEDVLKHDTPDAEIARRILLTGSPTYRRAFFKAIGRPSLDHLTNEERAVMAEGAGATGGYAIVYDLDPTIVKTSNGAVNPFRRVCRVVSITGTNEWRAVTSGAVVATYEAESTAAVDRSPTLAQPAFLAKRAQSLIDFSIELDQDWSVLQSEMAGLIQDSKDTLEATQFATGVGTTVFPQGMTVGFTTTATTGTTTVLAVNDIYKTEEALPPRFRQNAQWFANRFWYNKVRQLDTAGGANLWVPDLRAGIPANETGNTGFNLIGYPANEASGFAASLATTTKEAVLCAPNFYVIVERVGMNIELIPHFFDATTGYPTGRRLLYAMWRNTARVLDPAGGITLVGL